MLDGLVADGLTSNSGNINICLGKKCKSCSVDLTTENASKKNQKQYRGICRKCRSKSVTKYNTGNPKRCAYINAYARRKGIVKQYPCETCHELCYKKCTRAFCSDKCRFMAYIEKKDSCWIWTGTKNRRGYGKFCLGEKKWAVASRVSYELFKGSIEGKLFVCHSCDVPSCVNPDHLWVGSHIENMSDMIDKARHSSKLHFKQVLQLRSLWEKGWSNQNLCNKFQITSGTVSSIVNRRIWKHI